MTVIDRKAGAVSVSTEYSVVRLTERTEIRRILEGRRPYAAYALGQLEPILFRQTEWYLANTDGCQALVLHSRGGLGNATFAMGEAGALDAALRLHPGARHTFLTCEPQHLSTILRHYQLEQRQTMIRMQVTQTAFQPFGGSVRRLTGADARELNRLYRSEGVPSFYSSRQVEDAMYFGTEMEGKLVSVAGTHVISGTSSIAVVGNVYTHPAYRGRRLAQAVTSAVTERLLPFCDEVVLSVDPSNTPAVRAYERIGYAEVARLVEGAATRRDVLGAVPALRRAVARLRGRRMRGELVRLRHDGEA